MKNLIIIICTFLLLVIIGCDDISEEAYNSSVSIQEIEELTINSIRGKICINNSQKNEFIEIGICAGTSKNPQIEDSQYASIKNFNSDTVSILIEELEGNTTYFIRPFAVDSANTTVYGQQQTVTTLTPPTVTIVEISAITYNSAQFNLNLVQNNAKQVKMCGICINQSGTPDIKDLCFSKQSVSDNIQINASGLSGSTSYYARPFVSCEEGVYYGGEETFTTEEAPQRPQNVDYFEIETERKTWVYDCTYFSSLGQYRLSIKEYSIVTYRWRCSDSSVEGIIVSQNELNLTDGTDYSYRYDTYSPNGSEYFGMDDHVTGSFKLFIKTYNSEYLYSQKNYKVQVYIEPTSYYTKYSDSPNL